VSRLPRITGREVINALNKTGFTEIRIRGSHHYLYHQDKDKVVTVPAHSGKILASKTLKSILNQAGISTDELRKLL
jgi:predicted RNA binding protein YcfA (HicA-like mRNA interferase family)